MTTALTETFAIRLGEAFACGTLIGLERQYRQRLGSLIAAVRGAALTLYAVADRDVEGDRVEIEADVATAGRPDAKLERVVMRLGRLAGVSAASWKVHAEVVDADADALGEE